MEKTITEITNFIMKCIDEFYEERPLYNDVSSRIDLYNADMSIEDEVSMRSENCYHWGMMIKLGKLSKGRIDGKLNEFGEKMWGNLISCKKSRMSEDQSDKVVDLVFEKIRSQLDG